MAQTKQCLVETYNYVADAIEELKQLKSSVKAPRNTKLIFQNLPRHMRRRAMSHNPNRLPKTLRKAHQSQMSKAGEPRNRHRPSRKWRRRPRNLLDAYTKRLSKIKWLETHIWHARRFRMLKRWGYKLAYASTDKAFRANYRYSKKNCLLQDISYMCCIQLTGPVEIIKQGFSRLTHTSINLSITARTYIDGGREGSLHFYRADEYPYGALAEIQFMWQANAAYATQQVRKLWLWVHPFVHDSIVEELINVFQLKPLKVPACGKYTNATDKLNLLLLKQNLNRFRLTGPATQELLRTVLRPITLKSNVTEQRKKHWYETYVSETENVSNAHQTQAEVWNAKGFILPSNGIIALTVEDPRLVFANKNTPTPVQTDCTVVWSSNWANGSALWEAKRRLQISKNLISTSDLNQLRKTSLLVPGISYWHKECELLQPLPVLLIQRPGSQNGTYKCLGYGSGYDLILPKGTAMHFWLALIMRGAHAGGLRETETLQHEMGVEYLPDTLLAKRLAAEQEIVMREKYFRLPPAILNF